MSLEFRDRLDVDFDHELQDDVSTTVGQC